MLLLLANSKADVDRKLKTEVRYCVTITRNIQRMLNNSDGLSSRDLDEIEKYSKEKARTVSDRSIIYIVGHERFGDLRALVMGFFGADRARSIELNVYLDCMGSRNRRLRRGSLAVIRTNILPTASPSQVEAILARTESIYESLLKWDDQLYVIDVCSLSSSDRSVRLLEKLALKNMTEYRITAIQLLRSRKNALVPSALAKIKSEIQEELRMIDSNQ
jgi:hypothetical protein